MADHIYFPQVGGRGGLRKGGGGRRWPFGKSLEGKERIEVIMIKTPRKSKRKG